MLKNTTHIPLIILLLAAGYASFAAILPMPALPLVAQYFQTKPATTEAIMFVYLIGYALGQLIYGPISNQYGRKKPLIVGIWLSVAGDIINIIGSYLHNFPLFVLARFVLALGAAASLVITMILIKDKYEPTEARQIFSKVVLTFAFVPFIANALGGEITHYLGWQSLNIVLILYALILLIIIRTLPETLPLEKRQTLSVDYLCISYQHLLRNSSYLKLVILFSLGSSASYLFNALAPILAIKTLAISTNLYGYLSIVPAVGILIGGSVSTYYAHKIKAITLIKIGASLILVGSLLLISLFQMDMLKLISLYTIAVVIFIGHALIIPNAGMQAQAQITDHANGTSVMNAFALLSSSILVSIGGHILTNYPLFGLPSALCFIGLSSILLSIHRAKN